MALKENSSDLFVCSDIVTHVTSDFIALVSCAVHTVEAIGVDEGMGWDLCRDVCAGINLGLYVWMPGTLKILF